jgi:RND family efflux transporter MFP subunit
MKQPEPVHVAPAHDDENLALPEVPRPRAGTLAALALTGAGLVTGLFLLGLLPKLHHRAAVREETARSTGAAPRVAVVKPKRLAAADGFKLPSAVQAFEETTVYARTNGYLKRRLVDLGDVVKEGQLLAELETPEADQELGQARAALGQAEAALEASKAQAEFSRTSVERYRMLVKASLASQQDVDQKEAQFNADRANVRAVAATVESQHANVRRLTEIKSFARVTSPFAGKVTSRRVELGALVTAGNGAGQALFKVAQLDPVRVFVNVPQAYAPYIKVGEETTVTVREYEGRAFHGKITRTAGALDPASRTMLTEVQVPNGDGALFPGMFAQVKIARSGAPAPFVVPASALLASAQGTRLAVVDAQGHAHLIPIVIGDEYGLEVGIVGGLDGSEDVIKNPGERITEGALVTVADAAPPAH